MHGKVFLINTVLMMINKKIKGGKGVQLALAFNRIIEAD
jgi:hypothetical protein